MISERHTRKLVLPCNHGLHMRVAARVVALSVTFESEIRLRSGEREANAKSMISLMELGAMQGEALTLTVSGADAKPALKAITDLFEDEAGWCRLGPSSDEPDE